MSGPERIWWPNIILASVLLLLIKCINATEIDNDAKNSTPEPKNININDNYDMIDVTQRDGTKNLQLQTGQTTRILTSGEVDDNFWYKHLGEDFKYAIHLQVDDDQYNGIYNMTENGSNYEVKHDYLNKDIPVDGNRNVAQKESEIRYENHVNPESNFIYNNTNFNDVHVQQQHQQQPQQEIKDYEDANTISVKKKDTLKKRNENQMTFNNKYTKPTKTQSINIRLSHKQQQQQQQKQTQQLQQESHKKTQEKENPKGAKNLSISETPSIVVTLPNDDKTIHHLADEDSPVVVKMPPVIYHQGQTYTEYETDEHSNHTTHPTHHQHTEQILSTHNQYQSHPSQQQIQYENTDFTQYNPIPPRAVSSLQSPHSHSPPMTPLAPTQYYNPAILNQPTVYHSDTVYTSPPTAAAATGPNSITIPSSKNQLQKSADSIHFILRKPSTPYNAQPSHNQLPLENAF